MFHIRVHADVLAQCRIRSYTWTLWIHFPHLPLHYNILWIFVKPEVPASDEADMINCGVYVSDWLNFIMQAVCMYETKTNIDMPEALVSN